jgi:hypothetical protein
MDVARRSGNPLTDSDRNVADPLTFGVVDVSWTSPLQNVAKGANKTVSLAGALVKPSDGLEPSTPSLPLHARSFASTFVLQIRHSERVGSARA